MNEEQISARGERAAIGGYLPQFDAFARFAYTELVNNNLEWIKVADPEAEKLDDIQYSTLTEIHAYQVKWSIADSKISFSNFKDLFPLIATSWEKIKTLPTSVNKRVIPHLLTNKLLSSEDNIKVNGLKIGTFTDFFYSVWKNLKIGYPIDPKWNPIIEQLKDISKLNESEFDEFVKSFHFEPEYKPSVISVKKVRYSQQDKDLEQFSRFIFENVANPNRQVLFTNLEIIKGLRWENRFKTTFNQDLIIDKQKYQPIQSTIDLLNIKLNKYNNGYIFLLGGPGTGKSTLLTQWSKNRKERIVKYYAFDFINTNIKEEERGESTYMLFDIVFQIKEYGFFKDSILPYKDRIYLREKFYEQIEALGYDFLKTNRKNILIIDGLDHVPREYKSISKSFLRELPLPSSLPQGVYIILGSQSYELEDIAHEIKVEYKSGNRTIRIDPLSKKEIYQYLESCKITPSLSSHQRLKVFEKSQGHPLYLSYLVENIHESIDIKKTIEAFISIKGGIDNYYSKIWEPIQNDLELVKLLGLISRINGSVNPSFVNEWAFDQSVLKSFKERAKFLFNETHSGWTFFHNSFRQFLLYNTAIDNLTDKYDSKLEIDYHNQLANLYGMSEIEPSWKMNYHLFRSEQYDEFISKVTPDSFTSQLLEFRPVEEIRQDAKLGIEIAKRNKNIKVLIKYLFVLAEIESRLFHIDPSLFTDELLALKKASIAKNYLRKENTLYCSEAYALKASQLFIEFGDKIEGSILFNMAYPEVISDSAIEIDDLHRYREIRDIIEKWIYVAPHFIEIENILSKINNISFTENADRSHLQENESDLRLRLLKNLSYSLINLKKWNDLEQVIKEFNLKDKKEVNSFFLIVESAIEVCLDRRYNNQANKYLKILLSHFKKDTTKPIRKIHLADLIYKVTDNVDLAFDWIKDLPQPSNVGEDRLGYEDSLDVFKPLIKLNKLLNISGNSVTITTAIPSAQSGTDEEVMVEFERMLCLITQILSDGILKTTSFAKVTRRVYPIVHFYYKDISYRNKYWYKLTQSKGQYFDFLIYAVSTLNQASLESLGDYLFKEFFDNPKYWSSSVQRKIIKSLFLNGYDSEKSKEQLSSLESFMLNDHDINGRISECIAHSRLWLRLGELEIAEKWIKQSIQESIGVGYRKDYQLSTWIEWLRIINRKEPEKASDRIKWFLSHLNHIKDSTEGRAYWDASEKLLQTTFDWNFSAGFNQLQWQLNEGLANFADSISIFIESYIRRVANESEYKCVIQLYTEILLFISEIPGVSLLDQILKKGYSLIGSNFLKNYMPSLIDSIIIKSLEEKRFSLLSAIEKFGKSLNISIKDFYPNFKLPINNKGDSLSNSSNTLIFEKDHKGISEKEVLTIVNSFESFKSLVQEEDQTNSFFNWSKVIDKVTPLLSLQEIKEISTLATIGRRRGESDYFAKLSESALSLGDQELALSLANKSLELSSKSGWVKSYDGGTRIKAFNALKKINSHESSEKAFEVFSHDIVNGNYPSSYIEYLDDIIPLLTENFNEESIWPEIFNYLKRLMSNSSPKYNLPEITAVDKPITETFIDFLFYLSKSPVSIIKERSRKLLALNINNGNNFALDHLLKMNVESYSELEILNDVMMYILEMDSNKLIKFKSIAHQLAISRDYLIRKNAFKILSELKEKIPFPKNIKLPVIYSLHLDESQKSAINKELDPYFPEIDIKDIEDIIKPFGSFVDILSKESGINRTNIIYRLHSLMKEIGEPAEWTVEYEKKLRGHLEEIRLKYSFFRPIVITAKIAIMHLVGELLDSNYIYELIIQKLFMSHDYAVPFFNEISKPSFVQTLKESEFNSVGIDWLDRIEDCHRLYEGLISYQDNMKIIGEYSLVRSLNWGTATEIYMSQLTISNKIGEDDHFIFSSAFQQLTEDYYNLSGIGPYIIIIRDHLFDQFYMKSRWIAINPTLAKHLGWEPEPDRLFGWNDKEGNLMVESIFWSNGNVDMRPPHLYSESGEGWFVILSEEALHQIERLEHNLFIQKSLSRSKWEDSKFNKKSTNKILAYEDCHQD
jgi:hypothetical protein